MKRDSHIIHYIQATRPAREWSHFKCYRCKEEIPKNVCHRITLCGDRRVCVSCIGFYLSRYAITFNIPEPNACEQFAEKLWTAKIYQKLNKKTSSVYTQPIPPPIHLLRTGTFQHVENIVI